MASAESTGSESNNAPPGCDVTSEQSVPNVTTCSWQTDYTEANADPLCGREAPQIPTAMPAKAPPTPMICCSRVNS